MCHISVSVGQSGKVSFVSLFAFALSCSLLSDNLVIKMLNWYLVQLKPNGHRLAKANLERQGFKTFLPLQNVTKRSAHKFVDRNVPLFPGYMFVKLDIAQNDWRKVNSTMGVARIVSLGGTPTAVPSAIVNEFISRCDDDGILRPTQGSTAHTRLQKPQKSTSIQPQCQSTMPQSKSLNSYWGNRSDFLRFLKGLGNPRKQRQCGAIFR